MIIVQAKSLTLEQKISLFELWNSEYPVKVGYNELSEFENYLDGLSYKNHYLLVKDLDQILGWAFTFIREKEDWFGIIVNSKIHSKGFGVLLLNELKQNNLVLNGWVIAHQNNLKQNNEPYLSPLGFYIKNGFIVQKNIRIENEKLSAVKIRWENEI